MNLIIRYSNTARAQLAYLHKHDRSLLSKIVATISKIKSRPLNSSQRTTRFTTKSGHVLWRTIVRKDIGIIWDFTPDKKAIQIYAFD